jgi:TatD DNase family protein
MWGEPIPANHFSLGIHPLQIPTNVDWTAFKDMASQPFCQAIGECGLDKFSTDSMEHQLSIFLQQVEIANSFNKPMILHCVKSHELIAKCIKHAKTAWILHGFVNNKNIAEIMLEKGFHFSFGKALFSAKGNAQEVIQRIPLQLLFLETDAEETISIEEVYTQAASLLNCFLEVLQEQILQNFQRIFAIDKI